MADLREHLVGRRVAEPVHRGQDQLALRREPQAAVAQPAPEVDVLVAHPAPR